jgi:hypothetical protein
MVWAARHPRRLQRPGGTLLLNGNDGTMTNISKLETRILLLSQHVEAFSFMINDL